MDGDQMRSKKKEEEEITLTSRPCLSFSSSCLFLSPEKKREDEGEGV